MEPIGQHLPQLTPSKSGSGSLVKQPSVRSCSPETAVDLASVIIGCYRKGDCDDPEVFVAAASSVLSHYPEDVARAVADPKSGVPGKIKWFPSIYEIREACDIENARRVGIAQRDASLREQFAERDRIAAMSPVERRKAFIADWRMRMDTHFATAAATDQTVALADLDPRKLSGTHKAIVQQALEAQIANLTKANREATIPPLSEAARARAGLSEQADV